MNLARRNIIAGSIGNALEVYDYMIWAVFASTLSIHFLPPNSNISHIFILLLITYIIRPIGGFIGGLCADKTGRKRTVSISILCMGICTGIIGVLPDYKAIGISCVFILIAIRIIQAFSIGSEYINSLVLIIENSEQQKKGFIGSWIPFGVNLGLLISSILGAIIFYFIDTKAIPEWSWRYLFIFAFITAIFGYWIRTSLPESMGFIKCHAKQKNRTFINIIEEDKVFLKSNIFECITILILGSLGTAITSLIHIYSRVHILKVNISITETQTLVINSAALFSVVITIPLFGFLSDKIGRIKTIFSATFLILVGVIPYFQLLSKGSFWQIIFWHIVISIPCAALFATIPVFITEITPINIRCSIINLIYSFAAIFGGGITPLMALWLLKYHYIAPGCILLVLCLSSLFRLKYFKQNCIPSNR